MALQRPAAVVDRSALTVPATPPAADPVASVPGLIRPADRRGLVLILVAIIAIAVNLRIAVTSLGALLDEVSGGLHLSAGATGALTALPAAAFAAFGAVTSPLARRFGTTPLLLASVVLVALGQGLRATTGSSTVFLAASAVALAGIAVANILVPVVVKQYFPGRIGPATAAYTSAMVVGGTLAAAVSVPMADALGWRAALAVWAMPAALAAVPVLLTRRTRPRAASAATVPVAGPRPRAGRTGLGWALALFFGTQSFGAYALLSWLPQIYRDAGFSAQTAGLLLACVIGAGGPVALAMPWFAARRADQRPLVLVLAATMLVAYAGLAVAPHAGALVWTALLAFGQGSFPLALALFGLRARSSAGTAALSAFAQSVGYLIAMIGPLSVGLLYRATGGWLAPLGALLVALVIQAMAGLRAARPGMFEDGVAEGRRAGESRAAG